MSAPKNRPAKITRRRVIGEVAYRMEQIAAMFPRNVQTIAARGDGRKAAMALRDLADVLRDLEDDGAEGAWDALQEMTQWEERPDERS